MDLSAFMRLDQLYCILLTLRYGKLAFGERKGEFF